MHRSGGVQPALGTAAVPPTWVMLTAVPSHTRTPVHKMQGSTQADSVSCPLRLYLQRPRDLFKAGGWFITCFPQMKGLPLRWWNISICVFQENAPFILEGIHKMTESFELTAQPWTEVVIHALSKQRTARPCCVEAFDQFLVWSGSLYRTLHLLLLDMSRNPKVPGHPGYAPASASHCQLKNLW